MDFMRLLPGTELCVSALGLGTVKLGRNEAVKYPSAFAIPDDKTVRKLLSQTKDLGINLLDTAPAYGDSEARLGKLIQNRQDWIVCTKVGEEFDKGSSHFDFSGKHTRFSVERSLQRLKTDYLDIVLIHSDGSDDAIFQNGECIQMLQELKASGHIRAIGMSTKTTSGGLLAVAELDIVMLTYNLEQQDSEVLKSATEAGKGVLVKKGLMSGHISAGKNLIADSMQLSFSQPGIGSMIVGTINPEHLQSNVKCAKAIIAKL